MKSFLSNNKKAIGGVVIVVIAYYAGKYSAPEKVRVETVTVEVEKKVNKEQRKKVFIKENKDGSKETTIVVDTSVKEDTKANSESTVKEVTTRTKLNVSVLAGGSLPLSEPIFGISAQKNFIGPITLGVWGLTNKTGGISVGLNF